MKVAILTQYYPPEIGAPQTRLCALAMHLSGCGHDVAVLTAMPNYPRGSIYPGYGGIFREERLHKTRIVRTFIYPSQSARFVPRMMNYFSFVASASFFGSFTLGTPDFLMIESPPLFLGIAALWLKWLKDSKMIFNVSDLWPDSAVELGIVAGDGIAAQIAYWLEKLCYTKAWLITGQSRGIVENIRARFPGRPVFHFSNGVDTTIFSPNRRTEAARAALGSHEKFVAVYAGLHGHAQGLRQILEAASVLSADPRFRFVLIGDGPEKNHLQEAANELGLSNVAFLDSRAHADIPEILATADAILAPLVGRITGAVPSKMYEAMASGRPLVVIADGEPAELVREHHSGLTVRPNDVQGLVSALRRLNEDTQLARCLGENGRNAAVGHFDRTDIVERFTRFLVTNEDATAPTCPTSFASACPPRIDR